MKTDEVNLILGIKQDIHPKRHAYIMQKWYKQGLIDKGKPTKELERIKDLIVNKGKYIDKWDGRVVIVHFLQNIWGRSLAAGILEDCGDNGYWFVTVNNNYSFNYDFKDVAYIELHPKPRRIWTRLNFYAWKKNKHPDCYHKKISSMSHGTTCDYSQVSKGIFTYSNPLGKIGECYPYCQCKFLDNNI